MLYHKFILELFNPIAFQSVPNSFYLDLIECNIIKQTQAKKFSIIHHISNCLRIIMKAQFNLSSSFHHSLGLALERLFANRYLVQNSDGWVLLALFVLCSTSKSIENLISKRIGLHFISLAIIDNNYYRVDLL